MKKLMIFDFDGTLVDTITDVAISFNGALEKCGFPQYPLEEYGRLVGGNLETIVSRLLPQDCVTPENVERVKAMYRTIYKNSPKPNTKPYPGIEQLLLSLRQAGCTLAVNSNKGQELLEDMVSRIFPENPFAAVVGYLESRPSKPDPFGVDLICRECGESLENAVYVGDGASDIRTAENAGIPCVFVTWGQGSQKDSEDPYISCRAETAEQLRKILRDEV